MHMIYRIYSELYCLTEVVGHLNAAGIVHEILVDGHSMFFKSKEKYWFKILKKSTNHS